MSTSAHLACPARRLSIALGKPLRDAAGRVTRFAHADGRFADALWEFLRECAGERLVLADSGDADFETVAGYREIGGWVEDGDVPVDDYLAGRSIPPARYYAGLRPGRPRSTPSRIARRRAEGPGSVDEAFTRNLHWEPTSACVAMPSASTTSSTWIDEAEAVDVALDVIAARLRPVWWSRPIRGCCGE